MIKMKNIIQQDVVPKLKPPITETTYVREAAKEKRKSLLTEEWKKEMEINGQHFEIVADDKTLYDVFCVQTTDAGKASK